MKLHNGLTGTRVKWNHDDPTKGSEGVITGTSVSPNGQNVYVFIKWDGEEGSRPYHEQEVERHVLYR
jgi:hypothetical protein